jgi:hypothetical protein
MKIIMHKVIISHVILYACGNRLPKSREEQRVRVFGEQGTGKNIWASKRRLKNFMRSLMNYTPQTFLLGL